MIKNKIKKFSTFLFGLGILTTSALGAGELKTETFTGSVEEAEWIHYGPFIVEDSSEMQATLSFASGDPDLYVKFGSPPTVSSYDCRNLPHRNPEICTLTGSGEVYVSVRGYYASTFDLSVTYIPVNSLPQNDTVYDRVSWANWNHYTYAVTPGKNFKVVMEGNNDADLYVRWDQNPTYSKYDCRPYLNGSNEVCEMTVPSGVRNAHIGVSGYSWEAASYNITVTYE